MTIFIGADHRGFDLKNEVIEYLQEKNIRVEDMGNFEKQPEDDYVDYAQKVARAVLQNPQEFFGIVICGSGVGVVVAANRFQKIRCGLGFNEEQTKKAREDDAINVLALAANYTDLETAKKIIDVFLTAQPKTQEKYVRRIKKLDI